ncbi:hypothetical protein ITP53_04080 [Nonomuraea sp. K274]|uniref:Uncharacterized protein n=1 Tax=Nonomuraea cypriaca TaxID=1187855 RepID=A0A931A7R3_9ACTN|nr:hypothetical protein [Nonomuraea cypriaca]MBF8184930.1 hypothetical protein [Nonomuraea cypriaca]
MTVPGIDPSSQRLDLDLASNEFENGVDAGLWRLVTLDWPHLLVAITAGDGHALGMKILVDGYPRLPPSGQPWDLEQGAPLPVEQWPTGGTAAQIFRTDWSVGNQNAPYMACDRQGLATHTNWAAEHPSRAWNPSRTITFYLQQISLELQDAVLPQPAPETP